MKKKLLYIHHSGNMGGAPISLSYIIQGIDQAQYEPVLVNIKEGPINAFFKKLNIKFKVVNGVYPFHGSTVVEKNSRIFIKNWIYLLPSVLKAVSIIKKEKPDLIHLNSTCLFAFAIAANIVDKNIPVISHVREPLRKGIWGWPLRYFNQKYVNGFIAICENDLNSLELGDNSKSKSTVIYNFYERPASNNINSSVIREELGIPENAVVFLYLARFAESNGWQNLIANAARINDKHLNYHFILVGASKEYVEYKNLKNIHILKFRNDVPNLLCASDIFICPFIEPHFARGVIEASAFGIPVLGTNVGGVNELIVHGKSGYLYKTDEDFITYAERLAENKDLRNKLGTFGISFAEKKFNKRRNLAKTYSFYADFLV